MRNRLRLAATLAIAGMGVAAATAQADTVTVRSTTDTVDSGLYDALIAPGYKAANPGDTLIYKSEGTGTALANGRKGIGDAVVTHAPVSEASFVADGLSLEPLGRQIFYSDYVIVGPKDDPAGVSAMAPHDAISTFELIAKAGEAGKASYVTRNDMSGTNVQEQLMWGMTASVTKQPALNVTPPATAPAGQFEPGSGGTTPNWYVLAGNGTTVGQKDGLLLASACPVSDKYPNGGCYTMADRGTFNNLVNQGQLTNLKIVSDKNTADARGGLNLLLNPFTVYVVNPAATPKGSTVNAAAGTRFADFLTSAAFQQAVLSFPTAADPAFFSDAYPTVTGVAPPAATTGQTVPLSVTLTDKLPPQPAIAGIPVQLQASTDGGSTWSNVGAPVATTDAGLASFAPTVNATTTFRVYTPRFTKFSAAYATIGVVSAPPAPKASPAPPVAKVTKAALTGRTLTVTVSGKSTIDVVIAKKTTKTTKVKGKKKTKTTYKTAKKLTISASGAGAVRTKFSNLKPATYKLTLTTTNAAGVKTKQTVSLVLKAKKSVSKTLQ